MKFLNTLTISSIVATAVATASPIETADSSTLRYIPGDDLRGITASMKEGIFNLGSDGVLRTFANDANLTVLDYRQLDSDQIKTFISHLETQWQRNGKELPSSLVQVVESSVDGRLTTNIDDLLNPKEKPNIPCQPKVTRRTVENNVLETLSRRQMVCPGSPACESLADCTPYQCFQCFFPNGPPAGTCFV